MAVYDGQKNGYALSSGYALRRRPDPRIAAVIDAALGDARSVVNVGAGTGSYESIGRIVQAVEPSEGMIAQRAASAAPCVRAPAEALPLADGAYEAAMAILTLHHWSDWRGGLKEMRRVARRRIVLLTFDAEASDFWLTRDYFPGIIAHDRRVMPKLDDLKEELGEFQASPVFIPHDCIDGFLGAYWRRPAVYLDPEARRSMSPFATIDSEAGLKKLAADLDSGDWQTRNADLLALNALDIGSAYRDGISMPDGVCRAQQGGTLSVPYPFPLGSLTDGPHENPYSRLLCLDLAGACCRLCHRRGC
jgi:SAM-dependent methyltransferase